jgi:hypothetical protein
MRLARFESGSSDTHPANIYMGRKERATGAVAEVLEIPRGPDCLGARFNALWTARRVILAPQLPTLVGLLFQPSLNGPSAVSHMTAHPVADWAVALVPPAIQGVNGDAQHFRDIRKRHQLVTRLECHDHLPFGGSHTWAQSLGRSGKRLGRTARPVADKRPSKT